METQNEIENWLQNEKDNLNELNHTTERLEGMRFEENIVTTIIVDFDKPFEKWVDQENKAVKKLVPVIHEGTKKMWWLNTANPIYAELLKKGLEGKREFKIMRTGQKRATRYIFVG